MNVCVVSPHPDDETLGAGGTLLRCKEEGHHIFWLNMTAIKPELGYTKEQIEEKRKQVEKVTRLFDFDGRKDMDLSPTKLEMVDTGEIISKIGTFFDKIQPDVLILPHPGDAHSDHRRVFEWCYACTKRFRHSYIKKVVTMEILSETEFGNPDNAFIPNMYVDITKYIKEKMEILKVYQGELGEHPFPRNLKRVETLAVMRGAVSRV